MKLSAICAVVLVSIGMTAMADVFVPGEVRVFNSTRGCLTLEAAQDVLDVGSRDGYTAMVRRFGELLKEKVRPNAPLCGYLHGPAIILEEHSVAQVERDILGTITISIVEVNPVPLNFHVFQMFEN